MEEELEETEFINKNKKQLKQNNGEQINEYTKLMPSHLGVFILAHSRRIMNNFILSIDGFKKPEIFYTDTDSLYISNKNWNVLNKHGYVGNNLSQGKNDYGSGGIVFALFIAPKIKYCVVLNEDGILEEKITFKGYNVKNIKVLDFLKMINKEDVMTQVNKPWKRSFRDGVVIPDNEDLQTKTFNARCNALKRDLPDENYIMKPYNGKHNINEMN